MAAAEVGTADMHNSKHVERAFFAKGVRPKECGISFLGNNFELNPGKCLMYKYGYNTMYIFWQIDKWSEKIVFLNNKLDFTRTITDVNIYFLSDVIFIKSGIYALMFLRESFDVLD